jgi:hypothetical protein
MARKRARLVLPTPWVVKLRKSETSGWVTNERTGKSSDFICYDDGKAGFDHYVPKRIVSKVQTYCKRTMKAWPFNGPGRRRRAK